MIPATLTILRSSPSRPQARFRLAASAGLLLLLIGGAAWSAQTVPSIKMKVTLYDFRGNGSNPEFEPSPGLTFKSALLARGLVRDSLDAQRKPVRNTAADTADPRLYRMLNLYKWFRPWRQDDPVPTYTYNDTIINYTYDSTWNVLYDTVIGAADTITGDTLFKNIVIPDSLLLVKVPDTTIARTFSAGMMTAETTIIANCYKTPGRLYFPLNGRGFNDTTPNNDFTMEMHNSFTYHGGEVLKVASDDDCWAFINGRLALDLGNFHGTEDTIIWLDSLGLTKESVYTFDLFFADRARSDAILSIATTLDFVDKTSGTAVVGDTGSAVRRPAGKAPIQSITTFLRAGGVHVPLIGGAVSWTMQVMDIQGRTIVRRSSAVPGTLVDESQYAEMGSGTYLVSVSCRDACGRILWASTIPASLCR